jgi:hypothetical protein
MNDLEEASLNLYRKVRKKIPIGMIGDPVICNVQDEVEDLIKALDKKKDSSELSRAAEKVRHAYNSQCKYTRALQGLAARARASGKSMSREIEDIPTPEPMDDSIEYLCDVLDRYVSDKGKQGPIS